MGVRTVCGITDEQILWTPNEKMGKFILNEINHHAETNNSHSLKGLRLMWQRTIHRVHFITTFPTEVLLDLPFRIWHWCWRKFYQRKYLNIAQILGLRE